jgi:hypothetical protein
VEKNEDGPLASSHRLTRGLAFSVGSCQPSNCSQCIGVESVLEGERLTSSVVLYSSDILGTTKAVVGCAQPIPVSDSDVLMLIEPANEEGPDSPSQGRPARLSWRLNSEARTLDERSD